MAADGGSNEKGDKKKRLKLMPEILPDPKKAGGTGSARQRTMKTMERLIAVSAASALIAGADVTTGCGYGVVDPLPPPAKCPNLASTITAKATWKLDNGQFVIVLELSAPNQAGAILVDKDPECFSNGSLVSRSLNQGAMTITILPTTGPNIQSSYLCVHASCSEGDSRVSIELDVSAAPVDGADVKVSMYDLF